MLLVYYAHNRYVPVVESLRIAGGLARELETAKTEITGLRGEIESLRSRLDKRKKRAKHGRKPAP